MQCELCGRESAACRQAIVEGVDMILCPSCLNQHGRNAKSISRPSDSIQRAMHTRTVRAQRKDIYNEIKKELIDEWGNALKRARQNKGFSQEELGATIGKPTSTIKKFENEDLRPSDKTIKKLEKELDIILTEERKKVNTFATNHPSTSEKTLGDFIKYK